MIRQLALALLCASCTTTKALPTPTPAPMAPAAEPAAPAATSPTPEDADIPTYVPDQVATITRRRTASIVDVAPARPPSPSLRLGSVYVAAVLRRADPQDTTVDPTIFEWDVAGERTIAQVRLPPTSPNEQVLRIATTRDRVYVTSECFSACNVRLTVLTRKLQTIAERTLEEGTGVSLEANETYLAIAIPRYHLETRPLSISLFDATSIRLLATTAIAAGGGRMAGYVRGDMLELKGDRLYAVGRSETGIPRRNDEGFVMGASTVFAFDLPSLSVRASLETDAPAALEPRLLSDRSHIFLFSSETSTELTPELRSARSRDIADVDGTFGPAGQLFARPYDQVRKLFPTASMPCTSSWSGPQPLLVCTDDGGIRVARFSAAHAALDTR